MWLCPSRSTPRSPTRSPSNLPEPCVGGRVIVPFREKRLSGIVTELHDRKPDFTAKPVLQVLDTAPALTPELMQLGRWIAQYYIAPIGEVLRTMLPLAAEFRRVVGYRITDKGMEALHQAATVGSSRRSQKEPEHQMQEYRVLNRLGDGEIVREATLANEHRGVARGAANLVAQKVDRARRPQRCTRRQPHGPGRDAERGCRQAEREPADHRRLPERSAGEDRDGRKPARAGRSAHDLADAGKAWHRRAARRARPDFTCRA